MRNENLEEAINEVVQKMCTITRKDARTNDLDKQHLLQRRIKKGGEPTREQSPGYLIKVGYRTFGRHPISGLKTASELDGLAARADLCLS